MWASTAPSAATLWGKLHKRSRFFSPGNDDFDGGHGFQNVFLGVGTLHNKNEFRTNVAVRNSVSIPHNFQHFQASHKRTGAQPKYYSCSFWQNWSINLPRSKIVWGRSHFMAFKKFRNGCFGFRAFYQMTKQARRIEGAVQIRINFSGKRWSL